MTKEQINVKYPVSAVPLAKFAELVGKTKGAVESMVKSGKLPTIEYRDPTKPKSRTGEIWISITAFNNGMDMAVVCKYYRLNLIALFIVVSQLKKYHVISCAK
ncbi:TPA: Cox family DNA-binding protein [Providencia alcalifaciens]